MERPEKVKPETIDKHIKELRKNPVFNKEYKKEIKRLRRGE